MRTIVGLASSIGVALLLLVSRATAQQPMGPMMLFMGLFWVLLLVLMVLAILWLIKQLRK